jgi:hypothetical protein
VEPTPLTFLTLFPYKGLAFPAFCEVFDHLGLTQLTVDAQKVVFDAVSG